MTILLCIFAGAAVASLTAHLMLAPERRHRRAMALLRVDAIRNYGDLRRVDFDNPEPNCPVCAAQHKFADSECEQEVTS